MKLQWAKDGDSNSTLFHNVINKRKRKNEIVVINDMNGVECNTPEMIEAAFENYTIN